MNKQISKHIFKYRKKIKVKNPINRTVKKRKNNKNKQHKNIGMQNIKIFSTEHV